MLEFCLISIPVCLLSNYTMNTLLQQRALNEGNILKGKRTTKVSFIVNLVSVFIPFVNVLFSLFGATVTVVLLVNRNLSEEYLSKYAYLPEDVKRSYESTNSDKKELTEALIIDGADKKTLKRELRKANNSSVFAEKSKYGIVIDNPIFNKNDHTLANAQIAAKDYLSEIESNLELSPKDRKELLSSLRRVLLADSKDRVCLNNMSPIHKAEKILSKQKSETINM